MKKRRASECVKGRASANLCILLFFQRMLGAIRSSFSFGQLLSFLNEVSFRMKSGCHANGTTLHIALSEKNGKIKNIYFCFPFIQHKMRQQNTLWCFFAPPEFIE